MLNKWIRRQFSRYKKKVKEEFAREVYLGVKKSLKFLVHTRKHYKMLNLKSMKREFIINSSQLRFLFFSLWCLSGVDCINTPSLNLNSSFLIHHKKMSRKVEFCFEFGWWTGIQKWIDKVNVMLQTSSLILWFLLSKAIELVFIFNLIFDQYSSVLLMILIH